MKITEITLETADKIKAAHSKTLDEKKMTDTLPSIAMVTPSMNSEETIARAIESILNQNYPYLDYVVMDGGSKDRTVEIAKSYEPYVKVISEKDNGQSDAINKGFKLVNGDIANWLNADDWLLPGSLAYIAKSFIKHPDAIAIYGDSQLVNREEEMIAMSGVQPYELWRLIHSRNFIEQQSCFFKKDIFDQVGGLEEDLHYVMDWDLWIKFGLRGDLLYIPQTLSARLEVAENKTQSGNLARYKEIFHMCRKYGATLKSPVLTNYAFESIENYCQYAAPGALKFVTKAFRKLTRVFLRKKMTRQFKVNCFKSYPSGDMPPDGKMILSAPKEGSTLFIELIPISHPKSYFLDILIGDKRHQIHFNDNKPQFLLIENIPVNKPVKLSVKSENYQNILANGLIPEHRLSCKLHKLWIKELC